MAWLPIQIYNTFTFTRHQTVRWENTHHIHHKSCLWSSSGSASYDRLVYSTVERLPHIPYKYDSLFWGEYVSHVWLSLPYLRKQIHNLCRHVPFVLWEMAQSIEQLRHYTHSSAEPDSIDQARAKKLERQTEGKLISRDVMMTRPIFFFNVCSQ